MINRVKIKNLLRERAFEIYEAYELNDLNKIDQIKFAIYNRLEYKEYKGIKKDPLKSFIYRFMEHKFQINYRWRYITRSTHYRKTEVGNWGQKRKVVNPSREPYRASYTILESIQIIRL